MKLVLPFTMPNQQLIGQPKHGQLLLVLMIKVKLPGLNIKMLT